MLTEILQVIGVCVAIFLAALTAVLYLLKLIDLGGDYLIDLDRLARRVKNIPLRIIVRIVFLIIWIPMSLLWIVVEAIKWILR